MNDKAQMIIANRLRDGLTVFRAGGGWVEDINAGSTWRGEQEAAAALAAAEADAARNLVVGPYLITVTLSGDARRPDAWREAIRAFGPTVETGRNS